jgi:hypothetical protein
MGAAASQTAYLAERYWPGVDEGTAREAVERLRRLADGSPETQATMLIGAYLPGEQTVIVLLRATSRGTVLALGTRAALEFDRVSEAVAMETGSAGRLGRGASP